MCSQFDEDCPRHGVLPAHGVHVILDIDLNVDLIYISISISISMLISSTVDLNHYLEPNLDLNFDRSLSHCQSRSESHSESEFQALRASLCLTSVYALLLSVWRGLHHRHGLLPAHGAQRDRPAFVHAACAIQADRHAPGHRRNLREETGERS